MGHWVSELGRVGSAASSVTVLDPLLDRAYSAAVVCYICVT